MNFLKFKALAEKHGLHCSLGQSNINTLILRDKENGRFIDYIRRDYLFRSMTDQDAEEFITRSQLDWLFPVESML